MLPATPAAASPLIPELKLDKLMAAQQSRQEGKSEIEKAGEDVARSMGDLFANIGGSMDNLFQGDAGKPPVRQCGTICRLSKRPPTILTWLVRGVCAFRGSTVVPAWGAGCCKAGKTCN